LTSFTVIVPTYNRAGTILECLESIFAQTRQADQIVVVDDGSTDSTEKVLAPLLDCITYIRLDNGGVSAARNAGLSAATGEWITFLDSDDIWYPQRLAALARDINAADSDIGAHWANLRLTAPEYDWLLFDVKNLIFPKGYAARIDTPFKQAISGVSTPTFACRRAWAESVGGFASWARISGDTHFGCKIALQGPWMATDDILAEARRLDNTQIGLRTRAEADRVWSTEIKLRLLRDLQEWVRTEPDKNVLARKISLALFDHAEALLANKQTGEAQAALIESARFRDNSPKAWLKAAIPMMLGKHGFDLVNANRKRYERG
jgi:glycosyltransferase involved in cell wall biosynthesis